jgi:hypothetical protein
MSGRSGWSRLPRERNCLGCRGSAHRRRRPVSRELRWSAGAWPPLPPSERVDVLLLREGRPGRSWRRNRRFRYRNAVLPKQPCRSLKPHPAHTKGCATGSCTAGGLGWGGQSAQCNFLSVRSLRCARDPGIWQQRGYRAELGAPRVSKTSIPPNAPRDGSATLLRARRRRRHLTRRRHVSPSPCSRESGSASGCC